mmetsp:Transcript_31533/g.27923  ORF Transcript_31533/g.27923 Transcript_31533/m.27923 type:complete len:139 (+) Transcript_31533:548-964(+)
MLSYFRIFDFNETKWILKWTYIISGVVIVSYTLRILINILGFIGDDNFLSRGESLNGEDKIIHFSVIFVIEYIPILIWLIYITLTKGEIERTLSVSVKSNEMLGENYGYQKLDLGGTIGPSSNSTSRKTITSFVIEKY